MVDPKKIAVAYTMQQNMEQLIKSFKIESGELTRDEIAKLLQKFTQQIYNAIIK